MLRSMFSGVSGLRSHQTMMDVIGNNIANINTVGFKTSQVVFQDMLSQTIRGAGSPQNVIGGTNPAQVGLGTRVGAITTSFGQGASQITGRATDLAINGDGFYMVKAAGAVNYTRLGNFSFDTNGSFVTPDGAVAQGWLASNGLINTNASPTDLILPIGQTLPPTQTTKLKLGGNIPADAAPGTAITTSITVYDANGRAVPVSFTLTKDSGRTVADGATTAASTTLTSATAAFTAADVGRPISGPGIPLGTTIASVTNGTTVVLSAAATATAAGVPLSFGTIEHRWTINATAPNLGGVSQQIPGFPQTMNFNAVTGLPAAPLTPITLDAALNALLGTNFATGTIDLDVGTPGQLDALLQFAGSNSVSAVSQDGGAIGFLRAFNFGEGGEITGVFSNGRTQLIGQIALATFNNPNGLEKAGNSTFRSSVNSGLAAVGTAASGGRGTISGGTLEMSNVDLAQEFTNLIVAQRGFQANSRVITASDEILQDLVNLKR